MEQRRIQTYWSRRGRFLWSSFLIQLFRKCMKILWAAMCGLLYFLKEIFHSFYLPWLPNIKIKGYVLQAIISNEKAKRYLSYELIVLFLYYLTTSHQPKNSQSRLEYSGIHWMHLNEHFYIIEVIHDQCKHGRFLSCEECHNI